MTIHYPDARMTDMCVPGTLMTIYHLDPHAESIVAVASESLLDPQRIDPDNLPVGCRWVSDDEWVAASRLRDASIVAAEHVNAMYSGNARLARSRQMDRATAAIWTMEVIRRELAKDNECTAETHAEILRIVGWYYCQT